jgi:hypothetical protein
MSKKTISAYDNLIDYREYGNISNIFDEHSDQQDYRNLLRYIYHSSDEYCDRIEKANNPNLKKYDTFCILVHKKSLNYLYLYNYFKYHVYYVPIEMDIINCEIIDYNYTITFDENLENILRESREIPKEYELKNIHIAKSPYINVNGKIYKKIVGYNLEGILKNDDVYVEIVQPLFVIYYLNLLNEGVVADEYFGTQGYPINNNNYAYVDDKVLFKY